MVQALCDLVTYIFFPGAKCKLSGNLSANAEVRYKETVPTVGSKRLTTDNRPYAAVRVPFRVTVSPPTRTSSLPFCPFAEVGFVLNDVTHQLTALENASKRSEGALERDFSVRLVRRACMA